jgi:hypothetical protein
MKIALLALALASALPLAARAQQSAAPDPAPVRSTPFPDVPRNHWAYDAVEQLRQLGILRGYPPAATFTPKPKPAARPAGKRARAHQA